MKNEKEEAQLPAASLIRWGREYSKCINELIPVQIFRAADVCSRGSSVRGPGMGMPTASGINDINRLFVQLPLKTDSRPLAARAEGAKKRC